MKRRIASATVGLLILFLVSGCIVETQSPQQDQQQQDQQPQPPQPQQARYKVTIWTGSGVSGCGTDANVYVTIGGSIGTLGPFYFDTPGDSFECGSRDFWESGTMSPLGSIQYVVISHDNSGSRPGWLLSQVVVSNLMSGETWSCPFDNWIADDEGDGRLEKYLSCWKS